MNKKYLPSKQFMIRILFLVVLILTSFVVYKIIISIKNKPKESDSIKLNIINKIENDSNNNGIPDWEERLWGLNPKKNGKSNKALILSKRAAIDSKTTSSLKSNIPPTKNETLSREFFAAIISLEQTGNLNQNSIGVLVDSISQKIVAKPTPGMYIMNSLTIVSPSIEKNKEYLKDFVSLISKYKNKDIGSELILIIEGIASNNQKILSSAGGIATAYSNFAKDLINIPVPSNIAPLHLKMANDYQRNAQAIRGLIQAETNPLIGMKALINYKKYNDALVSDINKLSTVLQLK